jgi:SAM-dependent methyltransferase
MMNKKRQDMIAQRIASLSQYRDLLGTTVLEIGADKAGFVAQMLVNAGARHVISTNYKKDWPAERNGAIERRWADARQLEESVEPQSVDVIYGSAVLEHISELEKFFAGAKRILRPGGLFFLHGAPIWSSAKGHHVFVSVGAQKYQFNSSTNPIPDWAHLVHTKSSLTADLIGRGIPPEDAKKIGAWVYDGTNINRVGFRRMCDAFAASDLVLIERIDHPTKRPLPPDLLAAIEQGPYAGEERAMTSPVSPLSQRRKAVEHSIAGWLPNSPHGCEHPRRSIRLVAETLAISFLILVALTLGFPAGAATGQISVRGNQILRDGRIWIPKGVVLAGLGAPSAVERYRQAEAGDKFGPAELKAIANYGANLIRFQVSQGGLDPKDAIYSANYVDKVVHAVHLARSFRFAVIVSVNSERQSGEDIAYGLPTASTVRAWHELAPRLAGDEGVMFELYNEPTGLRKMSRTAPQPTWSEWRSAHQMVLNQIRKDGAHNVVIVEGLQKGHTLEGAPLLYDPDSKVVYGVHPYAVAGNRTPADWDRSFGNFAVDHPVLATEWNARSFVQRGRRVRRGQCVPDTPAIAADFLAYAHAHRIGVVGWAFDLPGTLMNSDGTPTNYDDFSCDTSGLGAGEMLHEYFKKNS